jgi:hypothetical protein
MILMASFGVASIYDNAPHHPEIFTFPHHKHIGENRIAPTDQPSISQVLIEIKEYLIE